MSAEMLTTLLTGLVLQLSIFGGVWYTLRRMDAAAERSEAHLVAMTEELKEDIAALRTHLKEDRARLSADLREEIADLRADVGRDFTDLQADLTAINHALNEMRAPIARLKGPFHSGVIHPLRRCPQQVRYRSRVVSRSLVRRRGLPPCG